MLALVLSAYVVQSVSAQEARGFKLSEYSSVSPFVEGSVTYDDNVPLNPIGEEEEDFYIDIVLGLSFLRQTEKSNLSLRGWFQRREYFEFVELDKDTWQENIEYVRGNPDTLQIRLKQRHGDLADYEFTQSDVSEASERREATQRLIETRTRRVKRALDDLEAAVARKTRKLDLQVRVAYSAVDFTDSDYDLYNWAELHLDPFLGLQLSEKTLVSLSGSVGQQMSDNDLSNLDYWRALLGLQYTPTEKTRLTLGGGLQEHIVPANHELDNFGFHFDVNGMWAATEKLTLQFFGRNEFQPTSAFSSNTKRVDQGSIGAVYDVTRRVYCTLGLSGRADNYTAPVGGQQEPLETLVAPQGKIVVRNKKKNIMIYLKARYEMFESNFQDDYNQLRIVLGANIAI